MSEGRPSARAVVRVRPLDVDIEVRPGETLIEAAWREGYSWPTVCYGQAECTACNVVVLEGEEHVSEVAPEEATALELLRSSGLRDLGARRLACRLEVHGPVVVEKRGVRPPEGAGSAGPGEAEVDP
jgi:2Fe-2S ferredoxin